MTAQHLAGLAHTVVSAAPGGTSFTDYLIGWGTAALAAATFFAVIVSIRQESKRRGRETAERDERWLAQARLVLTDIPGFRPLDDSGSHSLTFRIQNYSEQPVIDAWAEAWPGSADLGQPPAWSLHVRIVQPGPNKEWTLLPPNIQDDGTMRAWRYRWTDADGRQWCVDQREQPEPVRFIGQQPRPY